MQQVNPEKALQAVRSAKETNTSPDLRKPRDVAMVRFWQRMAAIYGHKWVSAYGDAPFDDAGKMTIAGDTWQRGLAGVPESAIAAGLQAALMGSDGWPPTLPTFRSMCFDIPMMSIVRRELTCGDGQLSPFSMQVVTFLDHYRWKRSDEDKADRLLLDAYTEAVAYVVSGNPLPEILLAIESTSQPAHNPATPETVAEHFRKMSELLGGLT